MGNGYELHELKNGAETLCYALADSNTGRSPIDDLLDDKKKQTVFRDLATTITRIRAYGITPSLQSSKLRLIDSSLNLYEIKNFSGVNRVMCCITDSGEMILIVLFHFYGHQGTGKIPKQTLEKAKRLAREAMALVKEIKE